MKHYWHVVILESSGLFWFLKWFWWERRIFYFSSFHSALFLGFVFVWWVCVFQPLVWPNMFMLFRLPFVSPSTCSRKDVDRQQTTPGLGKIVTVVFLWQPLLGCLAASVYFWILSNFPEQLLFCSSPPPFPFPPPPPSCNALDMAEGLGIKADASRMSLMLSRCS